jgi:hypothetical protein
MVIVNLGEKRNHTHGKNYQMPAQRCIHSAFHMGLSASSSRAYAALFKKQEMGPQWGGLTDLERGRSGGPEEGKAIGGLRHWSGTITDC